MAGKATDAGKTFLADLLKRSKLTAAEQAKVLEDDDFLTGVGEGALSKSEASRLADDLNTRIATVKGVEEKQKEWWETNKAGLSELETLRGATKGGSGNGSGIDEKALDEKLKGTRDEQVALGQLAMIGPTLSLSHYHEFKEVLDMPQLANDAMKVGKTLKQHYDDLVAPRRAEAAKTKYETDIKAAEERGKTAGRQEVMDREKNPYPVDTGRGGPSTLAGLRKPTDAKPVDEFSVDAAVRTVNEEMTKTA